MKSTRDTGNKVFDVDVGVVRHYLFLVSRERLLGSKGVDEGDGQREYTHSR